MRKVQIKIPGFRCLRCGHEWRPSQYDKQGNPVRPGTCPKCRSPYWDKPRGQKRGPKKGTKYEPRGGKMKGVGLFSPPYTYAEALRGQKSRKSVKYPKRSAKTIKCYFCDKKILRRNARTFWVMLEGWRLICRKCWRKTYA